MGISTTYIFHWFSRRNFWNINGSVWILNSPILDGWWQLKYFLIFTPKIGEDIHFYYIIFQGVVETTNQTSFHLFFFAQDDQIYELEAAELGYSLLHGFLVLESPGVWNVGGCYGMDAGVGGLVLGWQI